MARKATRLRFTKEELASPKVRQAAARAEKAADKADRAAEKAPKRRRLKLKTDKTAERKVHLTFEKQDIPAGELTGRGAASPARWLALRRLSFPTPFTDRLPQTTRMKTRPCRRRTPQHK